MQDLSARRELAGQKAEPGADFEHQIPRADADRIDDQAMQARVEQEVLAESSRRAEAVLGHQRSVVCELVARLRGVGHGRSSARTS